ncbi:hypothetical protein HTVC034P_gp02 [Pelagibacter phage HTVC034P]|nr:hypothetical protein HTVC034P_gp02 [Pelagibacter phage HTVC034P]
MTNSKVKWFDEDYDLSCDVSKLEELGFTNSTWHDDIAPSYSNDKLQIFFLNRKKFKDHEGRSKFSINKIDEHGEFVQHLYETDYFYKVLQLAKLSEEMKG